MPVFDYRCKSCGKIYDIFHKGKELVENVICPACGSNESVKLFSAPMLGIVKNTSEASCESCSDNSATYGGCSSGYCGLD